MRKHKLGKVLAILTVSLMMTGCGTPLFELTEEEMNFIAYSAARMVSKYNIQQKDGMINIMVVEEETEEQKEPEQESEQESEADTTKPEDTQTPNESQSTTGETQEVQNKVSFASAIGHGSDLSITYKGSSVSEHYTEGSYYSIDAESGNAFYIMKFAITNTSASNVTLDNVSLNGTFKLISGDIKVNSEVTFLNTDLATYLGNIAPGATVDTILLFEVPKTKANSIVTPQLQVIINKEVKAIKL